MDKTGYKTKTTHSEHKSEKNFQVLEETESLLGAPGTGGHLCICGSLQVKSWVYDFQELHWS